MKKLSMLFSLILLSSLLLLTACGDNNNESNNENNEANNGNVEANNDENEADENDNDTADVSDSELVDGVYRGTYDGEVTVRFIVKDDKIVTDDKAMLFMNLTHHGINYNELEEGHALFPVTKQYEQLKDWVKGKPVSEVITALDTPGDMIDDVDGYTGATFRGAKIKSAMVDAINRGVYGPDDVANVSPNNNDYQDGAYRGYFEGQATVWFSLKDNTLGDLMYRDLAHGGNNYLEVKEGDPLYGIVVQQNQILEYLDGKKVSDLNDLYTPGDFVDDVDGFSGATIRSAKVLSSINDGLNRGPYKPGEGFVGTVGEYEDGRYRGHFADQVTIQFNLENNNITELKFRLLSHMGNDYTDMAEGDPLYPVVKQNDQLLEYLDGKPLATIFDLYQPGDFVDDIDGFSGATVRGAKVLSAILDGLNRGTY